MNDSVTELELQLEKLKERNARVEADKAWETSAFRIGSIMIITYLLAAATMYLIDAEHVLRGALVPTLGYFLSTQSLPAIKRHWIARRKDVQN